MASALKGIILATLLTAGVALAGVPDYVRKKYVWKRNDVLSLVLFSEGLGHRPGPTQLYGAAGWLERNRRANPRIRNWQMVTPGTVVTLVLPYPGPEASQPKAKAKAPAKAKPGSSAAASAKARPGRAVQLPEEPETPAAENLPDMSEALDDADGFANTPPPPLPDPSAAADSQGEDAQLATPAHAPSAGKAKPGQPPLRFEAPRGKVPWLPFGVALTLAASLGGLWLRREATKSQILAVATRAWQRQMLRLFTCTPLEFEQAIDEALSLAGAGADASAFDALLWDEDAEIRARAQLVYQRLGICEWDRLHLLARRAEERLAAARRIASLADTAMTKEILEAFDNNVRLSAGDLAPLLIQIVRYDPEGVLRHLPACAAKPLLKATIRSLGEASVVRAVEHLTQVREAHSADMDVVAEIGQALDRLVDPFASSQIPRSAA